MIKVIILITKFIIATALALFLNSCSLKTDFGNGKKGNGNVSTEVRKITENFSSIDIESGIEVVLEQSSDKFVSVQAESNLQKSIDTKVENGVLKIEPNEPINTTKTIIITIRMPKIDALEASSGSKINGIGTFKGESISIDASSAAQVEVNIKYDNIMLDSSSGSIITAKGLGLKLETSASSGAEIEADELLVNEITADAFSGANVTINPIVNLNANASSGANIIYKNEPKSISKNESSGGNIEKD